MSRDRDEEPRPKRRRRRRRHRHGREDSGSSPESSSASASSASGWGLPGRVPPVPPVPPVAPVRPSPAAPPHGFLDPESVDFDESLLSAEERAYANAHRVADEKLKISRDAMKFCCISVALFIFGLGLPAFVVLAVGCVRVGRRYYRISIEPQLRERFVEEEVNKQVQDSVTQERQQLAGEHARTLEHLSASIAHEIRNPITAAKSLVQQMAEDPQAHDNIEYAQVALGELERVERSIAHLLRFARDEAMRTTRVSLAEVVDSALETFRERAARLEVEIVRRLDAPGWLDGDPEQLRRVVINLVGNAIDALEDARVDKPRIDVELGENLAGSEVWLRVRDNGLGIDSETLDKIFNPFFTSKEGGTGLGLSISKKLVEAHGGQIEIQSELGAGAEFVLTFPKADRG